MKIRFKNGLTADVKNYVNVGIRYKPRPEHGDEWIEVSPCAAVGRLVERLCSHGLTPQDVVYIAGGSEEDAEFVQDDKDAPSEASCRWKLDSDARWWHTGCGKRFATFYASSKEIDQCPHCGELILIACRDTRRFYEKH